MCCANLIYLVNFFLPTRNYFLLGTFSRRTFSLSFHQPMIRAVEASGPEKLGFPAWAQARVTKDWRFIVSNRLKNIWSLSCRFLLCCLYMSKNRLFFFYHVLLYFSHIFFLFSLHFPFSGELMMNKTRFFNCQSILLSQTQGWAHNQSIRCHCGWRRLK